MILDLELLSGNVGRFTKVTLLQSLNALYHTDTYILQYCSSYGNDIMYKPIFFIFHLDHWEIGRRVSNFASTAIGIGMIVTPLTLVVGCVLYSQNG